MQRNIMRRIVTVMGCVLGAAMVALVFGLFHGYFDHGQFEIENAQWSSSQQAAVIAKRSDHEALSGDQYFVLIAGHLPSPAELKHAYYGDGVIFRAGRNCLTLRWKDPNDLLITCADQ